MLAVPWTAGGRSARGRFWATAVREAACKEKTIFTHARMNFFSNVLESTLCSEVILQGRRRLANTWRKKAKQWGRCGHGGAIPKPYYGPGTSKEASGVANASCIASSAVTSNVPIEAPEFCAQNGWRDG